MFGRFSADCAHYKDLIHLNSFMYDFHLNLVLGVLSGEREIPEWLDVRAFLERFTRESRVTTNFKRNRLERGAQRLYYDVHVQKQCVRVCV